MIYSGFRSSGGHSSLSVLILVIFISLLFFSTSYLLGQTMTESKTMRQEWDFLIQKEQILKQIIKELESDPTPESHSPIDPVWDYITSCQSNDITVELKDLSSRLNPNFMGTGLFEKTDLSRLIINEERPDQIRNRISQDGLCSNLKDWSETFGEENLDRFFTLYSWANINVTHEESLELLYRTRVSQAGALPFRSRIQEGLIEKRLWKTEELKQVMGTGAETLYPVINCLPLMNVHYMEPLLLKSILSYPYGDSPLENHESPAAFILSRRKSGEISFIELKAIINPEGEQDRILEYMGTQTWFWQIDMTIKGQIFHSIIASYGDGWFVLE